MIARVRRRPLRRGRDWSESPLGDPMLRLLIGVWLFMCIIVPAMTTVLDGSTDGLLVAIAQGAMLGAWARFGMRFVRLLLIAEMIIVVMVCLGPIMESIH